MFTCIITVTIIAVTEEHRFPAPDRHGCDTDEILHYLELVFNSLITIFSIKGIITMVQALVLNLMLLYSVLHLLVRFETYFYETRV